MHFEHRTIEIPTIANSFNTAQTDKNSTEVFLTIVNSHISIIRLAIPKIVINNILNVAVDIDLKNSDVTISFIPYILNE